MTLSMLFRSHNVNVLHRTEFEIFVIYQVNPVASFFSANIVRRRLTRNAGEKYPHPMKNTSVTAAKRVDIRFTVKSFGQSMETLNGGRPYWFRLAAFQTTFSPNHTTNTTFVCISLVRTILDGSLDVCFICIVTAMHKNHSGKIMCQSCRRLSKRQMFGIINCWNCWARRRRTKWNRYRIPT